MAKKMCPSVQDAELTNLDHQPNNALKQNTRMLWLLLTVCLTLATQPANTQDVDSDETDGHSSRKILGSSVVTSVSVVMETNNGKHTYYADAVGQPLSKPNIASQVASPINLLNPDRYEFYTFNDDGELVKRLMTLKEIQGIIAGGDSESAGYNSGYNAEMPNPDNDVTNVVENVQNVLKEEIEAHKNPVDEVTESVVARKSLSAIVRELYTDGNKGRVHDFYKERVRQFYDGHVEEVDFKRINNVIRRRTNALINKQTRGQVPQYLEETTLTLKAPLSALSTNIFQADCSKASTEGRDGELYFIVLPTMRQRRLVPIPAAVWRSGFIAGYDPELDATAASKVIQHLVTCYCVSKRDY
ncbi:uncharacterized protein CBL_05388 [Carabus blaptoides fortunei]